jgi:hypothetical protein
MVFNGLWYNQQYSLTLKTCDDWRFIFIYPLVGILVNNWYMNPIDGLISILEHGYIILYNHMVHIFPPWDVSWSYVQLFTMTHIAFTSKWRQLASCVREKTEWRPRATNSLDQECHWHTLMGKLTHQLPRENHRFSTSMLVYQRPTGDAKWVFKYFITYI